MQKEGGHFTCPHCQKTFTEYPNIRKHIGPFHAEKRFSCTVCTKSFTGGDKLKTHLVRHSEAKDFMCDDCGEQCKRKDKLGEHEKRMHKERPVVVLNETKPLECDICGKRSLKNSGLAGQVKIKQNTPITVPFAFKNLGKNQA